MNYDQKHHFSIGGLYQTKQVDSKEEYLEIVLEVEKGIAKRAVENENEIFWTDKIRNLFEPVNVSLGYGVSGVVYFYIQLYEVTKDEKYLSVIRKGLTYVENHWKDILPEDLESAAYPWPDGMQFGMYFGLAGIGSMLTVAYKAFGWEDIKDTLLKIVDFYKQQAIREGEGITWTRSITTLTDGGILLFLTGLYEVLPSADLKELIGSAGRWYIARGVSHENGGLEYSDYGSVKLSEPDFAYDHVSQPNFELGSAGAGYVLARIYQTLGEDRYLEAAKKVIVYLDSIKIPQEKGFLIPYRIGDGMEPLFYLGNCHGAAGTGKVYYLLYHITGDQKYLDDLHGLFDGFESLGAPERMSGGLWNNVSVCCGHAGILNTFLGLYLSEGNERWHELAERSAGILAAGMDGLEDGKKGWVIAYRRIKPDEYSHTIYYNDGDAGIASALLQLYLVESGRLNPNRLADDPFITERN